MDHNFMGDPLAASGYWAPQTSNANFCEIDYNVSHYIAEFINTVSNLAFVWQAVVTLPPHLRGHGREFALWKWPVEALALLTVGLGSAVFHMTLLHNAQVVDETGMYFITGAIDYRLWSIGQSELGKLQLAMGLSGTIFGVIGWNFLGPNDGKTDNALHLALFVGLLSALWPRALYLVRKQSRERKTAPGDKNMMKEFQLGVLYFVVGFILWLMEGQLCYGLRHVRSLTGMPLGWILELHGWWHFLTALGAGKFVQVARELTARADPKVVVNGTHDSKVVMNGKHNGNVVVNGKHNGIVVMNGKH